MIRKCMLRFRMSKIQENQKITGNMEHYAHLENKTAHE
jgi:hypothetical protein